MGKGVGSVAMNAGGMGFAGVTANAGVLGLISLWFNSLVSEAQFASY